MQRVVPLAAAPLSQLFAGLGALRIERVEPIVPQHDLALLGFLVAAGLVPLPRLSSVRKLQNPMRWT